LNESYMGSRERSEGRRNDLDPDDESGPKQSSLARCCCSPMLHPKSTRISQVHGR
jgi:hypothetical protein